jgi:hypothetical protein
VARHHRQRRNDQHRRAARVTTQTARLWGQPDTGHTKGFDRDTTTDYDAVRGHRYRW